MPIICTGSVAYDYLMTFPGYFKDHILPERLESISLSFLVDSMVRQRGGVAPNIAYTLALLGDHPWVMATVGEDFEEYRSWLNGHGINTDFIKAVPGKYTASFFANTDQAHNQICSFYTGAMAHAAELSIKSLPSGAAELVLISPNDPDAMREYARECTELKIPYLYDPSQQVVRMNGGEMREGVEHAECLFVNEYEHELLIKHTGLSHADMLRRVKYMVITRGKEGATVYAEGKEFAIPAVPPREILDPTGVGDAFRGGFLRGVCLGFDWQTCGQMGSLAASYCLEYHGTQNHTYTREEFTARYRQYFDDKGLLDTLLS